MNRRDAEEEQRDTKEQGVRRSHRQLLRTSFSPLFSVPLCVLCVSAVQSFSSAPKAVQLRIPGPTPLPDAVREATGRQMINHRSPEFAQILAETVAGIQTLLQTTHDVLLMSCSGTGGMEAAVANLCSPGDEVIAAHAGVFGARFAAIAAAYGLTVHHVTAPDGQALDPLRDRRSLRRPSARQDALPHP